MHEVSLKHRDIALQSTNKPFMGQFPGQGFKVIYKMCIHV